MFSPGTQWVETTGFAGTQPTPVIDGVCQGGDVARRSGWGGALPADDDEAAQRIVAAARRIVEETGRAASVSEVTRELQITRQTVYRYFPGVEALTNAVAIDIGTEIGEMLTSQLAGITDPVDAIVELLASAIETVRANPVVADGLTRSAPTNPVVAVTGSASREFTVDVLRHLDVDWVANGIDDDRLDELAAWLLLIFEGFASRQQGEFPGGSEIRAFLRTWLAPSITAMSNGTAHPPA